MSEKQTMNLEYKFTAEDTNLSSIINKMEANLESFNGETKEVVNNLNKAEKEMRDFASATDTAKRNVKNAEDAFEHLNSTSKQNKQVMNNLAQDMVKATALTKKLADEQKRLYKESNSVLINGATTKQKNQLTDDINTYRGQIVELNNLDKRLASGYKILADNRDVALTGYRDAQDGSPEKAYFASRIKSIDESLNDYRKKMNSVAIEKAQLMDNFMLSDDLFNKYAKENNQKLISSERVQNNSVNSLKAKQRAIEDKEILRSIEDAKKTLEKTDKIASSVPSQIEVKSDIKVDEKSLERAKKGAKEAQELVKNTNRNLNELNGTKDSFYDKKSSKVSTRKPISLTDSEIKNLEKAEEILTKNKINYDTSRVENQMKKDAQAHKQRIEFIDAQKKAEQELIDIRTKSDNSKDTVRTDNDIRKYQANNQAKIERDNNASANRQKEIALKKNLDLENKKALHNYKQEQKAITQSEKARKKLISNLDKEANKYKNMSKSASNYRADLKDIEKQADNIIKKNVLEANSYDAVEKKIRSKDKAMLGLSTRYEDNKAKTISLLQSAKDYETSLVNKKSNLESEIQQLNKLGTESTEAKSKLNSLQAELKQVDSEMDKLASSTSKLLTELNQAGGEIYELGSDFEKLDNKIDKCKSSIDSFSNNMAKISKAGETASAKLKGFSQNVASFGNSMRNVGSEIMNVGREMQVLSLVSAGIFGSAIKIGMDYEAELANVKSTMNTVGKEAGYLDRAMEQISNRAREISSNSIYSPDEVMESAKYLSLAGYDLEKILTTLEPMTNLMAVSGLEDASHGVDLLTDSLASLGLGMRDLENNESDFAFAKRFDEEATLYMDTMAKLQSVSNQNILEGMEAMIYAGGEFDRLNIPLEQAGALLGILASRGLKSAEAGRGLSSTLINLTKESGQSYEALKELQSLTGIDVFARFDENGAYKLEQQLTNINTAFDKIKEKYGNEKGAEIVNRITSGIAGKTQIKTFAKLLEGYKQEYSQIKELLSEDMVEGSLNEMVDRKKDNIEYKYKMMIASIQESLVDLFTVIKPYVEKIIETITSLSDAFKKLSDDEKLGIAKLLVLIAVIPFLITAFGALVMVIGTVITAIGSIGSMLSGFTGKIFEVIGAVNSFSRVMKDIGFLNALGTKLPLISGQLSGLSAGLAEIGASASATGGALAGFTAKASATSGILFSLVAFAHNVKVAFLGIKESIKDAGGAFELFNNFLKNPLNTMFEVFSNIGKHLEHSLLSGFKSVIPKLSVALVNIGRFITKAMVSVLPGIGKVLGSGLDKIFDGLENKAKAMSEKIQGFKSVLDEEAIKEGYESYDDKKSLKNTISFDFDFNGLEEFTNGALGKLLSIHKEGIPITIETIGRSQDLMAETVSQYKSINKMQKENENSIKKESELSTRILKVREEMAKHKVGSDEYKKAKEEYESLASEKEMLIEYRVQNQEEIEKQLVELEEKKATIKVEYEEAVKQGLGDEYIYHNLGGEFEKEFGISLVFDNRAEVESNLSSLLDGLPEAKRQLEIAIDANEGEARNKMVGLLTKLESMELAVPVALEIIKEQDILKTYGGADGEVAKKQKVVQELEVKMAGVKEGGKAWKELSEQLAPAKEALKEAESYLQGANNKLAELEKKDPTVFKNAIELSKQLTENKDQAMFNLFNEEELKMYEALTGKKFEMPKIETNGSTPIADSIEADVNKAKEHVETFKTETGTEYCPIPEGSTPITDNVKEDVEQSKATIDELAQKTAEISGALGNVDMSNLVQVFSTVLAIADVVRQRIIDIGNVANNSVKANFSGMADGAIEDFVSLRERLISIGNVANNFVKSALDNCTNGLSEKLVSIQEQFIQLGGGANANMFSSMTPALQAGLNSCRDSLISICNVAGNLGISSMSRMGQSASAGLDTARSKLLSICNVALNRGISAMSSMGGALTSALSSALSTVNTISSRIGTTINKINNIKMPTIPSVPTIATVSAVSMAPQPVSLASTMRGTTINNNSRSTTNTSSFNFAIDKVVANSNADLRNSARQLTTYCKRKGLF